MAQRQVCEDNKLMIRGDMVPSSSGTTTTTGFCSYTSSDHHHHLQPYHHHHQIQPPSFVSDPEEIFNLTAGMEMIGFHKNHHLLLHQQPHVNNNNTVQWKSIISKPAGQGQGQQHLPHQPPPSSSKTMNHESTPNIYHQQQQDDHFTSGISETTSSDQNLIHDEWRQQQQENNNNNNMIRSLIVDADSSSSSSVLLFPSTTTCEGNETTRPSQAGLSLSLSNSNINPSTFYSHSFPLRQTTTTTTTTTHQNQNQMMLLLQQQQQQQQQQQDGYLNNANKAALYHYNHGQQQHHHHHQFVLKNSKYLLPAQELLNEFCSSLDTKQGDLSSKQQQKSQKQYWELEEDQSGGTTTRTGSTTSSSKKHSLTSIEFTELQKRKTKLLSMLEEVDRRYRHYRNQMKAVVSSFEGVAGNGAAKVYSALALKAMSRHFKCLKDGILGQIETTRKSLGEKDIINNNIPVGGGGGGGETTQTPRLKIIDQTLRQQRAFQQMSLMESTSTTHPWRPQRGLPERSVSVLRAWLFDHFLHPYPSDVDKHILSRQTGLSRSQVSNWFINARVRLWKPMVEEMYLEETKENENNINNNIILPSSDWISTDPTDDHNINVVQNQNLGDQDDDDQKPTPDRLVRFDSSECPPPPPSSSFMDPTIIKNNTKTIINNPQVVTTEMSSFGSVVELDFSSYTQQHQHSSGVSLTLGLQQHAYGGTGSVSLAFPSQINNHQQSSLLYSSRDHQIDQDHCDQSSVVQYMDGDDDDQDHHDQNQLLPYRNLMGAQLLHDLAG